MSKHDSRGVTAPKGDPRASARGGRGAGRTPRPLLMVTKFEFVRQLKKPSFWATIILVPVMLIAMFVISMLISNDTASTQSQLDENTKILITDNSGIFPKEFPLLASIEKDEGIKKVVDEEIDLYFYIPENFAETKKLDLYHISEGLELFNTDGEAIKAILKQVVSSKFSDLDVAALTGAFDIIDNKLTKTGEESKALGHLVIPLTILIIYFFFVTLFGGRLLMTVVEEKENRISEMILTSVSTKHLIIGKILSAMLLGLIQILTLIIPLIAMLIIYRDNPTVSMILSQVVIDPPTILTNLILLVFSIFLVTGFLTYIGTVVPTAKDASQFIGPVIIGVVFPLYFMQSFFLADPSAFVYFLTYFPLSAPTALMLRSAFGTLTTPELLIGLAEITVLSVIIIKITIKSFQKNAINFTLALPTFRRKR